MALQKKFDQLLALKLDVVVVQECSVKSMDYLEQQYGYSVAWFGKNKHKGLGVACASPWRIRFKKEFGLNWIAQVEISGPIDVDLFAVWACAGERYEDRYIRQVHLLLDQIEESNLTENVVILGDFNSNARWDKNYRGRGHSDAVRRLQELGFSSAYHEYFSEPQGGESRHTLSFRRDLSKTYHIDYIFLSFALIQRLKNVHVGTLDDWVAYSDHAPMVAELLDE